MAEKKRLHYIDIAKGIAMLLVLFGHCSYCPTQMKVWLYSFHMPLFFALSGMTFSVGNGGFKEFFVKKSKGFLLPYVLLSVMLWTLIYPSRIILDGFKLKYLKTFVGILIGFRHTEFYFTMWFILALYVAEILLYCIVKMIHNKKLWQKNLILLAAFLLCIAVGYAVILRVDGFVWSLDLAAFALAFLICGYLLKLNHELFSKLSKLYILPLLLICNLGFAYLNYVESGYMVDLYYGKVGNILYYAAGSVFGLWFTVALCFVIKKCRPLEYIGKNSLIFYAFQNSLVIPFCKQLTEYGFRAFQLEFNRPVMFVIIMILSIIVLSVMTEIINRYMPFVLGKAQPIKR